MKTSLAPRFEDVGPEQPHEGRDAAMAAEEFHQFLTSDAEIPGGKAETSLRYLAELKSRGESLSGITDPAREAQAWSDLVDELRE